MKYMGMVQMNKVERTDLIKTTLSLKEKKRDFQETMQNHYLSRISCQIKIKFVRPTKGTPYKRKED